MPPCASVLPSPQTPEDSSIVKTNDTTSISPVTRRRFLVWTGAIVGSRCGSSFAAELDDITAQPYFAAVNRAVEVLAKLGSPVVGDDVEQLAILARQNDRAAVDAGEKILNRYTLARVRIDAGHCARVVAGGAERVLIQMGWRVFLVRVANSVGSTEKLSPLIGNFNNILWQQLRNSGTESPRAGVPDTLEMAAYISDSWLTAELYDTAPMTQKLSGYGIEYRVMQLYARDHGKHQTVVNFTAGDIDPRYCRKGVSLDFDILPARTVNLQVRDTDGRGCVAALTIKDHLNRIYPLQAMRLAPDLYFQPQIYRGDGETVCLADGEFTVESKRGPEYLNETQTVEIGDKQSQITVHLKRWIDPSTWGWYSGDTHIHAGGCAHYQIPTEGVSPETIIRQARGEGLSVGDVLSWGPSWSYQKLFFTGHTVTPPATLEHPELQAANNATLQPHATAEDFESILRYDVEVSGFPSSHAGHLVLLRLKEQDYPGTKQIEDWPSWNLPILRWARAQGAVAGYAHCGNGMAVDSVDLPNYEIPPMDSNGTQEAIVDVTHGFVDFLSGCDTTAVAELNAWYHMLNCGFRMAMIGETDFPCITDDRVGAGRSYVRLDERPLDDAGYDRWIRGLQEGRLYCGDGRSHFLDFKVNGRRSGSGDLTLNFAETIHIDALVAARLEPQVTKDIVALTKIPKGWHVEKARIGDTREVAVELIVNGLVADKVILIADGTPRSIKLNLRIAHSSWIALRILPSSHTHPVFALVGKSPIRASKRSAQWCRACVDKVWEVKSPFMRESERAAAAEAFDHARKSYDQIISECEVA